ncbi:MAG: PAS domain S-box protein, partial [Bacteroidales bacterium]|nr:PAS domain S-box protein [Bacteroidales bacterium]
MAGLKITICFWYLDPPVVEDVLKTLKKGKLDVTYFQCGPRAKLSARLSDNPPDLIVADFDSPDKQREVLEKELEAFYSEVPLIYLVGEENERGAADALKAGAWDYILKGQLYKLIPSVYSSQKYSKVIRQRKEAERALCESRDRYMSIFKSVNDGILLFDFETRKITDYNPRVLELFETTEADMAVLEIESYSVKEEGYTIERAREYIAEAAKGKPVSFEWRNVTKNGRKFWTLNSFSIVQLDDKPYILLVTRDIDSQKKMEQSLLTSQEHFLALAENSPDVIMRFDRDHRHVYVNSAVETEDGLKITDFINKSHREMGIFPEDKVQLWEDALETVFKSRKPHTIIFDISFGGRTTSLEWRLYPETGSSEGVDSVIGVARDITDTRESEDALKQSEERLNLALQATELGLWDWNLVTNEVYLSPIWLSMLGY